MRCLALAQAAQDVGRPVHFVSALLPSALESRIRQEDMAVQRIMVDPGSHQDVMQTLAIAEQLGECWMMVDGYHFGAEYQKTLKDVGMKVLFVDDYGHADYYYADFLLNQNLNADELLYDSREPHTELLIGTRYTMLRQEFRQWAGWQRQIPAIAKKILVTLGGGDPDNVTRKAVRALRELEIEGLEAVVVVGGSNPHLESLRTEVEQSSFPIDLHQNVTNMPELMMWADIAISAGGSTSWEMAFFGVPRLVIVLADNQREIARQLELEGAAINLGGHEAVTYDQIAQTLKVLLVDEKKRRAMAERGHKMVDGRGVERVIAAMSELQLRRAIPDDCSLLWEWANDPVTRQMSFSSDPIPWDSHVGWFESKINDPNALLLIAFVDSEIGQVRFDLEDNTEAVIGVSIAPNQRGMGYGARLIQFGTAEVLRVWQVERVHAYIKPSNIASLRVFEKAGYQDAGIEHYGDHQATHMIFERNNVRN